MNRFLEVTAVVLGIIIGAVVALPLSPKGILTLLGLFVLVAIVFELRYVPRDRGDADRRKW